MMSNSEKTSTSNEVVLKAVLDLSPPPEGALRVVVVESYMNLRRWDQMKQSFRNAFKWAGVEFQSKVVFVLVEPGENISTRIVDEVTGLETSDLPKGLSYSQLKAYMDACGHKPSPIELPEPVGFKVEPRGEVSTQLVDAVTGLPRKESSD